MTGNVFDNFCVESSPKFCGIAPRCWTDGGCHVFRRHKCKTLTLLLSPTPLLQARHVLFFSKTQLSAYAAPQRWLDRMVSKKDALANLFLLRHTSHNDALYIL